MEQRPHYWDDLDPDVRAAMEEVIAAEPPYLKAVRTPGTPEHTAKMKAAREAAAEFEREFGPFTEEERAEAQAIVEESLGIGRARRNTNSA